MKKLGLVTIGFVLFSWQLFAQESKKEKDPDEQIIVNKKYDEHGNLIQFDSTYVHQWSSDSTFQFPDERFFRGNGMPDIDEFFKNFLGDSAMAHFNFPDHFGNMPFNDDEFFRQFPGHLSDSMMIGSIPFDTDSSMQYFYFNDPGNVPPGFEFPNFEEFEKQLNEQLKKYPLDDFGKPQFKNEDQQNEWQELMDKHKKEIEELKRKWEENNQ